MNKIRKMIRLIVEELCNATSHSQGWLTYEGKYIDIDALGLQHTHFARQIGFGLASRDFPELAKIEDAFEQWYDLEKGQFFDVNSSAYDVSEFLMDEKNWIRVANAYKYEGPPLSKISGAQINKMIKMITNCGPIVPSYSLYSYDTTIEGYWENTFETKDLNQFLMKLKNRGKEEAIGKSLVQQFHISGHGGNW